MYSVRIADMPLCVCLFYYGFQLYNHILFLKYTIVSATDMQHVVVLVYYFMDAREVHENNQNRRGRLLQSMCFSLLICKAIGEMCILLQYLNSMHSIINTIAMHIYNGIEVFCTWDLNPGISSFRYLTLQP